MSEKILPFRQRRPRYTAPDIESHLRAELVHWLPFSMTGEGGDTMDERRRTAAAAAKIITDRLAGKAR